MVPLRRRAPLCSVTGTDRAFADLGLAPPLACREPSPVRPSPRSRYGSSRAPEARQVLFQSSEALRFPGPAMIVSGGMRSNRGPCSRALPLLCSSRRDKSGRLTEVVSRRTRIDFHQQTERSKLGQATQTCTALLVLPRHAGRYLPLGLRVQITAMTRYR